MAENYLEMAAAELASAKRLMGVQSSVLASPKEKVLYEQHLRFAAAYTRLAAIQAGLPAPADDEETP